MPVCLSVNLNAVAQLRNRRDLPWPSVTGMGRIALEAGAQGLTVHPRPDERHINEEEFFAGVLLSIVVMAISLHIGGPLNWVIAIDNISAESWLFNGAAHTPGVNRWVQLLFRLSLVSKVQLSYRYIASALNSLADAASRQAVEDFKKWHSDPDL